MGSGPGLPVRSQEPGGIQGALEREVGRAWATSHLLSGQTLAAHISPDATDAEPSLPQEPRRLWCIAETQVPRSAVLPLIPDLKAFPRRPLESNKPGGLDCLCTSLNPSCLLSLCWPCQPFHRLAIRSFMYLFMYSFIHSTNVCGVSTMSQSP